MDDSLMKRISSQMSMRSEMAEPLKALNEKLAARQAQMKKPLAAEPQAQVSLSEESVTQAKAIEPRNVAFVSSEGEAAQLRHSIQNLLGSGMNEDYGQIHSRITPRSVLSLLG